MTEAYTQDPEHQPGWLVCVEKHARHQLDRRPRKFRMMRLSEYCWWYGHVTRSSGLDWPRLSYREQYKEGDEEAKTG